MTTPQKFISGFAVAVLLVSAVVVFSLPSASPIALSCSGVSTSSNASLISIVISNQSATGVLYFVGSPVFKSNGVWGAFQCPSATKLVPLGVGQSAVVVTSATPANREARVPVLWGFTYTSAATRWQQLREDVADRVRMPDSRGRGALYTNYVVGIKL